MHIPTRAEYIEMRVIICYNTTGNGGDIMENLILALEIIGTVAFAVSGAVISINKRLDIFGVIFCAVITALGGGVLRDMLLANLPPVMFREYIYVICAVATACGVFIAARLIGGRYTANLPAIDRVNNIFDALGLGVFTVVGINTAVSAGYGDNAFFAVFLGMTTGIGGGIIRDIVVREVPLVLSKRIYAVASMCGGIVYYLLRIVAGAGGVVSAVLGITVVFALRLLASVFRWDLPRAID